MAVEIKPVTGIDELERWVAIHNAVRPEDPTNVGMKTLVRASEQDQLDVLAYVDGVPAGTGMIAGDEVSMESGRPWVAVNVLPEFRGRGVGGAVFAALSAHARKQDASGLACEVLRDDAYSLSFLERHGFSARRSWVRLELDLGEADGPDPMPPEGVELTSLADEPGLLPQMHEVAVATYPELGGHYARHADSFLRWQVYELGNPALPLDLTRIASAGGRAVGFATMHLLLDGALGELRMVVVLEEWRQRGVARALVGSQIDGARRRGVERVMTWVPEDGPVTFYRRLGLQPRGGSLELVGPLF